MGRRGGGGTLLSGLRLRLPRNRLAEGGKSGPEDHRRWLSASRRRRTRHLTPATGLGSSFEMTVHTALALVAALAVSPVVAPGADYRVMGEDERAISLIEGAIKTDSDGHRETVYYFGFSEPISGPGGTQAVSGASLFDCAGGRYKVGGTAIFKADMTLVERHEPRFAWRDIVADSPFSRAR